MLALIVFVALGFVLVYMLSIYGVTTTRKRPRAAQVTFSRPAAGFQPTRL